MSTYDLLVRGGMVIDPSQGAHALLDIGIDGGVVAAMQTNIDPSTATQVYDATGCIVTPGLVDLLAHPWPARNLLGIDPDHLMKYEGTTTVVSPGDPGPGMCWAFKRDMQAKQARVFAYVMISEMGYSLWPYTEVPGFNPVYLNADDAAGACIDHSDVIVGIKVRISEDIIGGLDVLPVQLGLQAALTAQAATGKFFPVVVHTGDEATQTLLAQTVALLRPGDVITHMFDGNPNAANQATGFAQNWAVQQAAYDAQAKGIILDVGWGGNPAGQPNVGGSTDYLTAVICMVPMGRSGAGIRPNTLSSDAHAYPRGSGGLGMHLTEVMSNMLALNNPANVAWPGFASLPPLNPPITLDDVVRMATVTPAQVINRVPLLGTLQPGAPGDVAVLKLVNGPTTFVDSMGRTLAASQKIVPVQTIKAGVLI